MRVAATARLPLSERRDTGPHRLGILAILLIIYGARLE